MRNCASGMQALDSGINNILAGRSSLVLAGGVDALSRAPLLYGDKMVLWFSDMAAARSHRRSESLCLESFPSAALLAPVIGIMKGLTDPMVGLLMGQTAENLAHRFGITREQMDAFSVRSHESVIKAQDDGILAPGGGEVEALYDAKGNAYTLDDGVRRDASLQNLAKLKPFFDRKYGNVTPGNSSQITDGAAWLILASEEALNKHDLKPIGRILDSRMGRPRSRADGPRPGARGDADPQAQRPRRSTTSTTGRSTRRSPRRCSAASRRGRTRSTAAKSSASIGPLGDIESRKAQRRRRRHRARPPGGRLRRAHRAASAESTETKQREARHGLDLHRRRPGRRDAGGGAVRGAMERAEARPGQALALGDATATAWPGSPSTSRASRPTPSRAKRSRSCRRALDAISTREPEGPGHPLGEGRLHRRRRRRGVHALQVARRRRSPSCKLGWDVFQKLRDLPFPTTAMVNGFCMGGGVELALACRYRVALDDPKTRFALPEVMLGIMPAWHGVQWLPKLVGPAAAFDMLLTGKSVDAKRAKRIGLVDQAVPLRILENTARIVTLEAQAAEDAAVHAEAHAGRCAAWSSRRPGSRSRSKREARALPGAVRDPRAVAASTTAIRSPPPTTRRARSRRCSRIRPPRT